MSSFRDLTNLRNFNSTIFYKNCVFRFENCWPAFRKDVQGVIFVYSKITPEYVWELEKFYDYFVNQTKLEPKNCVVFYFAGDKSHLDAPKRICEYIIY